MPPAERPVVTFLSDYGQRDDFVGVCHGVIARLAPGARVIDITHGVPRHDVRAGALTLRNALPYMPPGVHLAVVDPEVGAQRGALAVRTADGRMLVGPDNGLLSLALERFGGAVEVVDVRRSPWRLEPVSATFHGRDVFAPVAARLAAGDAVADAGEPRDPEALVKLDLPRPRREGDALVAHAVYLDGFGNAQLDVSHEDLAQAGLRLGQRFRVEAPAGAAEARFAGTFTDVAEGEALVYEDAYRTLALAINRGSAVETLGLEVDSEVRIGPG